MARTPGLSVRLKLTLSYAGFLLVAGGLLVALAWLFLFRDKSLRIFVPNVRDLLRALDPSNFGPVIFGPAATALLVLLLVFGLVGGWLLAGRMLAPLNRITEATRKAANGSLSHRIRLPGRLDEFRELADAFDAMLAKLEAHVAEQQRFAANASHELRTPLAITRTLLDVARNNPESDSGDLVERLSVVNTRAVDLAEALLVLSRVSQRAFKREAVDLSLVAEEAIETLLPIAEHKGVVIETSGDDVLAFGSHPLLLQMTTNLLHNAIVHNLPEAGWVRLAIHERVDAVDLLVENSGETVDPAHVAILVEPFQRGVDRVGSAHAGVGLGLAIVKSIVDAHDGDLFLTPREEGGLCITVRLPLVQSTARLADCSIAR